MRPKIGMRLITLYLPEPYIKALDRLVNQKYYPNRAEAIRVAIRDLLSVEAWETVPSGRSPIYDERGMPKKETTKNERGHIY